MALVKYGAPGKYGGIVEGVVQKCCEEKIKVISVNKK